jgi:hypothetical protein
VCMLGLAHLQSKRDKEDSIEFESADSWMILKGLLGIWIHIIPDSEEF